MAFESPADARAAACQIGVNRGLSAFLRRLKAWPGKLFALAGAENDWALLAHHGSLRPLGAVQRTLADPKPRISCSRDGGFAIAAPAGRWRDVVFMSLVN